MVGTYGSLADNLFCDKRIIRSIEIKLRAIIHLKDYLNTLRAKTTFKMLLAY